MEEEYWKRFLKTGKIKDYLYYKGMKICTQVMERYTKGHALPDEARLPHRGADYGNPGWS